MISEERLILVVVVFDQCLLIFLHFTRKLLSTRCRVKVFEDSEMMNQMMSQPAVSTEMIDDDELRQELNDLLAAKVDTSTPFRPPTADRFGKHRLMIFRYCWCYCQGCCLYTAMMSVWR